MHMTRGVRTLAALAALLVAVTLLPSVSRAGQNEQTDLQIRVVGLQQGSQRTVLIRVTNLSVWWSDKTVATVQTVSPVAGNQQTFSVPDINTVAEAPLPHVYEFTYILSHDCNGDVVKATLSPGTNYAGVPETNLANNTDQQQICPPGGASASTSPATSSIPAPSATPGPSSSFGPSSPAYPGPSPSTSASSGSTITIGPISVQRVPPGPTSRPRRRSSTLTSRSSTPPRAWADPGDDRPWLTRCLDGRPAQPRQPAVVVRYDAAAG